MEPCVKDCWKLYQKEPSAGCKNAMIVAGSVTMEDAKITGITPDILTFIGMFVDWPP